MPKKFDPEVKARAVRMVRDHLSTYGSVTATAEVVGSQLGISENTLRRWVIQADVDDGRREGVPSEVQAELARLQAENKRLRETNEILRRASIFFAGNSTPAPADLRVHRRAGQRRLRRRVGLRRPHR
ncbi:MAG: transposase, partial [Actinomycetota bacterium]|nr:transposase [Actinomycetota bacterium]